MPFKRTSDFLSESLTDEEIDSECESEVDSASSDEEDQLEIDESLYDDELLVSDFSEEDEDSDEAMESPEEFYSPNGSFLWNISSPDLSELEFVRETRLSSGLLFPVLGCVEMVDFFSYLIDDTLLNHILDCTNKRHDEDITLDELK